MHFVDAMFDYGQRPHSRMKKSLLGLALASALLAAGAAHADNAQGPYVGGGIGFTHHTVKDSSKLDYDTNNFSYGIYGGYRFNEHWSVQGTFEHLSNGRGIFGIDCGTNQIPGGNQGLNNYGVRVGYAF